MRTIIAEANRPRSNTIAQGLFCVMLSAFLMSATAPPAVGTDCWEPGEPLVGADLIVGEIAELSNFPSESGAEAFSLGPTTCNIGSQNANWQHSTPQHPVAGQNMFRLKDGQFEPASRFEQIGQAWAFHEFFALASNQCGCGCNGQSGALLGAGCSNPHASTYLGVQSQLGPKSEVNAFSGTFPFPPSNPGFSGSVARRLQVKISDLDPAQDGGGLYFLEVQYIAADDSATSMRNNNASYRAVNVMGSAATWNAALTGSSQREKAGIRAWKDNDSEVTETDVQVSGEGLFILAAKATDLGTGFWQYEYAVQNLNSHRSAGSFSVPIRGDATVENVGFHDVDYHSGEPYDLTDWPATIANDAITWSTDSSEVNPNANALRWGTLYNFRFDAALPPGQNEITLGLFRPGSPATVSARTVVPASIAADCDDGNACTNDTYDSLQGCGHAAIVVLYADVVPPGGNLVIDVDDLLYILGGFVAPSNYPDADLAPCGGNGIIDSDDIIAALTAFVGFDLCPHPCPP